MEHRTFLLPVFLLLAACGRDPAPERTAHPDPAPQPAAAPDPRPLIVAFGNSLSAGYGVESGQSYPDYLQKLIDERGYSYRVVNLGVSGDTTSAGLVRLESVTALQPAIVILEFGGNDGLRGLPVESTRQNLEEMIVALRGANARVVLAGITLPRNYGADYIARFDRIFPELAAKHKLPLIPFLLDGVAQRRELMQRDGIHPTAEGNRRVAALVMKTLEPLLAK